MVVLDSYRVSRKTSAQTDGAIADNLYGCTSKANCSLSFSPITDHLIATLFCTIIFTLLQRYDS